ncbi:hypothetical protein UG55_105352 [Frankia sp. EI5c]|nr:hypothetical protein UG55_105352 [Frankia sp. EI5c]
MAYRRPLSLWLIVAASMILSGVNATMPDGWRPCLIGFPVGALCLFFAWLRRPRRRTGNELGGADVTDPAEGNGQA